MKPVYTWLLFDADHTILDFDAAEAHALEAVCTELAGEFRSEWVEAYHRINKGLWALLEKGKISSAELRVKRFADFQAEIGIEGDSAVFSTRYLHHLQEGNYVIPGARELMESLAPDFRMAVITNGIRDTQKRRFEVTGLGSFFEHIIISEDAGVPKPHTGFFDYAFERMGDHRRETMLVIGDSLSSDIKGANNAGIPCCWYNPQGKEAGDLAAPDFVISELSDLEGIVYRD
jgi:YjjG family noncanonical pyrimidine nucleotidase